MKLASFEALASALEAAFAIWIRDKGMQVLQFWSDAHRETSVDVFVTEPFAFDEEYARALVTPLHDSPSIRFVSLSTLISRSRSAA